jgi:hypothetical protein
MKESAMTRESLPSERFLDQEIVEHNFGLMDEPFPDVITRIFLGFLV